MSDDSRITLFAEILLPIPVPGTFTYRVPYTLNDAIRVGQRAVVQFGKTKIMSGLVVAISEKVPTQEVKFLTDLLEKNILKQCFSARNHFASKETLGNIGDIFCCHIQDKSTTSIMLKLPHNCCHLTR